ncbi:MAG: hypothetical protein WA885_10310 [Phormidesmis sp.]
MAIEMATESIEQRRSIGICQARWPIQVHTANIALALARSGFDIDLFLYDTRYLIDMSEIESNENICVYSFDNIKSSRDIPRGLAKRTFAFLRIHLGRRIKRLYEFILFKFGDPSSFLPYFIPSYVIDEVDAVVSRTKNYHCLIGIEKTGLVWAGNLSDKYHMPYVYFSLELYTKAHSFYKTSFLNKLIKKAEEKYHFRSDLTIIQDSKRAEVLLRDNGLEEHASVIYLPVSMTGSNHDAKSSFLQDNFYLEDDQIVILQFGKIDRYGSELTEVAQYFPHNWQLILHDGILATDKQIALIKKLDANNKVTLSLKRLKNSENIKQLVASAHIGLVFYPGSNENDKLTAFSSEKLALYLQCGVPVVTFDHPGYEVIEKTGCGISISQLSEIGGAVRKILEKYELYCQNARNAFLKYYCFENNVVSVVDAIKSLPSTNVRS